jgi:hypothetical protein
MVPRRMAGVLTRRLDCLFPGGFYNRTMRENKSGVEHGAFLSRCEGLRAGASVGIRDYTQRARMGDKTWSTTNSGRRSQ